MRFVYSVLLYILIPFVLARLLVRSARNGGYLHRWNERFGYGAAIDDPFVIWVHAVSVGETRVAAPLIKALMERYPQCRVLVTTMTPTGSEQVRQILGESVSHRFVPYDLPGAVRRFLDRAHPRLAVIMETEYWPNLFHGCAARGIPLLIANVRMSERSARAYRRFARLTRATLDQVTLFGVQSEADARRIRRIGARDGALRVTGNMKFEVRFPASLREAAEAQRREWGAQRPVWIAASTHEGEDQFVLEALHSLRQDVPHLLLVLVPRHPERFGSAAQMARRAGFQVALRSDWTNRDLPPGTDVYIGDSMGELLLLYGAADVAFIGGSLVPRGGHNMLEACAQGVPVVFGPHTFNFEEIAALTLERRAGFCVRSVNELEQCLRRLLADPNLRFETGQAGQRMVAENRGALDRTLALVEELLPE